MSPQKRIFLTDYTNIANIHADRLHAALTEISPLLPFTADKLSKLTVHQLACFDMATMRFSKLQDLIGSKIFPLILENLGEDALTFIDKINKLEKLGYINDANWWMELREIRNQMTHDYPDDYEIIASHTSACFTKSKELLEFWDKLKQKIKLIN